MTDYIQPAGRGLSHLQVGSINDADSFDTDRLSGSVRYDEDDDEQQNPPLDNNNVPQSMMNYPTIRKDDKKSRKKEEENEKRLERQREKDEKKARKQEEKDRKKSQSQTRFSNERNVSTGSNKTKAQIVLLDDSEELIDLGKDDTGKMLYERVCDLIHLEEKDYFGLTFSNNEHNRAWMDNDKRVRSQLKGVDPVFYLQVKFYPPEPALLQEDLTRYQLCLQLRQDMMSGKLPCSFVTYALLGSYTAQAELGDYIEEDHGTTFDYLKGLQFAPSQDNELLRRIHEQHRRHQGQPPSAADLHFLENAKKLAMYGVDIHPAQDSENVDINIGVSANGLLIYRDKLRINRFAWPKILKISYKRRYFFIKLRPSEFDRYESTIGFKLPTYRAAKSLWKIAVEHHAFFRLRRPEELRKKPILPRFNSTFRYTGTYTYHQARQLLLDRPNPDFERSISKRMTKSLDVLNNSNTAAPEVTRPSRPAVQRPLPRPQSVEPFFETHNRVPIPDKNEDDYPRRPIIKDPEYARVNKKPEREVIQKPPEVKPKRPPPPPVTYVNVPPEPPVRPPAPREPSPTMDPDEALLAAIRLATDLDPNKQAEQVVMNTN
ncbi:unnamed protein product [Adineta steineri]|uniref:FERM domain-containing protein n=2 Tax=Adineta steineri TaxID=433720 RepID=A0A815L1P0_9BILA|nr:unnamed protein product [Adineta steineri]CAF1400897.1 unnamed protein product [Adineta steineri]